MPGGGGLRRLGRRRRRRRRRACACARTLVARAVSALPRARSPVHMYVPVGLRHGSTSAVTVTGRLRLEVAEGGSSRRRRNGRQPLRATAVAASPGRVHRRAATLRCPAPAACSEQLGQWERTAGATLPRVVQGWSAGYSLELAALPQPTDGGVCASCAPPRRLHAHARLLRLRPLVLHARAARGRTHVRQRARQLSAPCASGP